MSVHVPARPTWTCAGCANAWPCETRRRELLAEYSQAPVSLALHLGAALVEATGDLPHAAAGELHRRFVGWIRPRRGPVTGDRLGGSR